jgi:hypothetical protein
LAHVITPQRGGLLLGFNISGSLADRTTAGIRSARIVNLRRRRRPIPDQTGRAEQAQTDQAQTDTAQAPIGPGSPDLTRGRYPVTFLATACHVSRPCWKSVARPTDTVYESLVG